MGWGGQLAPLRIPGARLVPRAFFLSRRDLMPKVTFYPLGNADSTLIDLTNGEKILFDYANRRCPDDKEDKRADLPVELRKDLGSRDYYDVVAFTHLDQD